MEIRICRECAITSDQVPFKDGKNLCKSCNIKYFNQWKKDNAAHLKTYRSTPEFKKKRSGSVAKCNQKSPESFLRALAQHIRKTSRYKQVNAKKLNPACLDVKIDYDYLLDLYKKQEGRCALLGIEMTHIFNNLQSISVDRIDSTKGYLPGNVQLVCQFINTAKKNFSNADCQSILDQYYNARQIAGM